MALPTMTLKDEDSNTWTILDLPPVSMPTQVNRRILPRMSMPFTVRITATGDCLKGIDLSFGGLMCIASEPIWPGNEIAIELSLPGDSMPLPLNGRVVELVSYRGRMAMRLRFENITTASRRRIATWMGSHSQPR
jgi:hypothetical protein